MKGVILHGGYGTKLRPLTHTGAKQLIPVANKPISQYVLEDLKRSHIHDIVLILGDLYPEKVKEHYGDGQGLGVKIHYLHQDAPHGIAHAVSLCEEYVGDASFVAYLGDNMLKGGIKGYAKRFEASDHDAMVLLCEVGNPQRFGVAQFDKEGKLIGLIEKPKKPPSNYALTGIYFLRPIIFDMIRKLTPSRRGELEITEALQLLLNARHNVGYEFVKGWWKDTGTPEDILEANRLVLDELQPEIQGTIEDGNSIQGRVSVGQNTTIETGAIVRGPAIIGADTTIAPNVYIGPYTSVGNHVTIKRGEIENSIIMDHTHIDANERITDSLIAAYSKIVSNNSKPQARRFILGERSHVEL
jgi:glucose-1-phosphate thymidylyltransferase